MKFQVLFEDFDIKRGWDFSVPQDPEILYYDFLKRKPDAPAVTIPCDQLFVMQNMSKGRIAPKVRKLRVNKAMELLKFAVKLADAQLKAGRHVIIEHPIASQMWGDRCMRQLFARYTCCESRFDQCELGLTFLHQA